MSLEGFGMRLEDSYPHRPAWMKEATERDLHGGRKPRDPLRLASLAVANVGYLLEVIEWGEGGS